MPFKWNTELTAIGANPKEFLKPNKTESDAFKHISPFIPTWLYVIAVILHCGNTGTPLLSITL